jgi:hypothetical protein
MTNFRRLALVSGIAVLGAIALTPKAHAQFTDVNFSGNVPGSCTINSVTNGTLALNGTNQLVAWTGGTGGTPGSLNITCSTNVSFTINSIADNGTTATAFANLAPNAAIMNPSGNPIANFTAGPQTSPVQTGPINAQTYTVDMIVNKAGGGNLPAGTYGLRVNISLNPQ